MIIRGNRGSIDDQLYRESEEEEEFSTYTPRRMVVRRKLSCWGWKEEMNLGLLNLEDLLNGQVSMCSKPLALGSEERSEPGL